MKYFSFNYTKQIRKTILSENKDVDSLFIKGRNNVLITVPHGVSQTRLGKYKVPEIGAIQTGFILAQNTQSNILIKTQNNFDDANFDVDCKFRKKLKTIVKKNDIKWLIDIHGLAKWRDSDINLGTNFGKNIDKDVQNFNNLVNMLKTKFRVSIDQPFMATGNTISCCMRQDFDIFTLQMEINCGITNYRENIIKFNLLLDILSQWIKTLK